MRIFLIAVLALVAGFIFYQMSNMNEEANRPTAAATQMKTSTAYQDLVDLFREFREFQRGGLGDGQSYSKSGWILPKTDAVPDFSAAAMAEKYRDFGTYRAKLKAIDFKGWSTAQQVDYHLVRAEMNGYEFQHRVLSPWSRDPGFYGDVISKFPQELILPLEERVHAQNAVTGSASVPPYQLAAVNARQRDRHGTRRRTAVCTQ